MPAGAFFSLASPDQVRRLRSSACIWGPDVSSIGEVIGRPVTSSESFFPAALFSLAPLVLDFDARMAVECISFGQRPDPGFVSSNFAPKPSMLKVCLASISCRWCFPAGLGTHCGAALYQTCFLAILGLEPAEQDAQETDNFTDECLVMPCDVTAAALVEARRKMKIKAALFEHVLGLFSNMLDSRGCL